MDEYVFEDMKEAYHIWDDYNKEYLQIIFSNNSIANEYYNDNGGVLTAGTPLGRRVEDIRKDIRKRNNRLNSIISRLSLIPVKNKQDDVYNFSEEHIGRDKVQQSGLFYSIHIDNSRNKNGREKEWYEKPIGIIIIGVITVIIAAIVTNFFHLTVVDVSNSITHLIT